MPEHTACMLGRVFRYSDACPRRAEKGTTNSENLRCRSCKLVDLHEPRHGIRKRRVKFTRHEVAKPKPTNACGMK